MEKDVFLQIKLMKTTMKFLFFNAFESKICKWSALLLTAFCLTTCGVDMPKETESSFETMTVEKKDIEIPIKFSAKMRGQSDVNKHTCD